eukprot:2961082-Pyramimonas_sp.AAC.1
MKRDPRSALHMTAQGWARRQTTCLLMGRNNSGRFAYPHQSSPVEIDPLPGAVLGAADQKKYPHQLVAVLALGPACPFVVASWPVTGFGNDG